jgi:hypothetical protein
MSFPGRNGYNISPARLEVYGWKCTELSTEHGWQLLDRGDPVRVGEKFREFAEDQDCTSPQGHFCLQADIAHPDEKKRAEIMRAFCCSGHQSRSFAPRRQWV